MATIPRAAPSLLAPRLHSLHRYPIHWYRAFSYKYWESKNNSKYIEFGKIPTGSIVRANLSLLQYTEWIDVQDILCAE